MSEKLKNHTSRSREHNDQLRFLNLTPSLPYVAFDFFIRKMLRDERRSMDPDDIGEIKPLAPDVFVQYRTQDAAMMCTLLRTQPKRKSYLPARTWNAVSSRCSLRLYK